MNLMNYLKYLSGLKRLTKVFSVNSLLKRSGITLPKSFIFQMSIYCIENLVRKLKKYQSKINEKPNLLTSVLLK